MCEGVRRHGREPSAADTRVCQAAALEEPRETQRQTDRHTRTQRQALEFSPSQGAENEGESLTKTQHSLSMVSSGWLLVPNYSFWGHFNLDSKVTFLPIVILLAAKILRYHLKRFLNPS